MQNPKKELLFYVPNARESFDPSEAHELGAFEETALSLSDAEESTLDLVEALEDE